MLTSLAASIAIGLSTHSVADSRIIAATFFRNGYGFVQMETPLSESGVTYVSEPPEAVEGTLWFAPSGGARISEVTATWIEGQPLTETAQTIPEILALNVGKTVSLGVAKNVYRSGGFEQEIETVFGRVLSVTRSGLLLQTDGALRTIAFGAIVVLNGKYEEFNTIAKTEVKTPVLRVLSDPGTKGSIRTICLVQGLNWIPAYDVELGQGETMFITMKATILDLFGEFEKVNVGLMSGFPQIERVNDRDPLTDGLEAIYTATQDSTRMALVKGSETYGGGVAGFASGGSGGFGGGQYNQAPSRPDADKKLGIDGLNRNFANVEAENYFIYAVPMLDLKRSERKYLVIDEGRLPYKLVHKMGTSSSPGDVGVSRVLRFDNGLRVPLTSASAIIIRDGELVGKATMPYTYMGDQVEIALGAAPYIKASSDTSVLGVNRAKIKLRDGRVFDEILRRDTVTVRNLGSRPSDIELAHSLRGDSIKLSSPGDQKRTATQDSVNFDFSITWKQTLAAGATQSFSVEYSYYQFVRQEGGG